MSQPTDTLILSKRLLDTGYPACANVQNALQAMEGISITEESIAQALAVMVRTHSKLEGANEGKSWHIENFVNAIKEKSATIDWIAVMGILDRADFIVYDAKGFKMVVDVWKASRKDEKELFPIHVFLQPWMNVRSQLSVLYQMVYGSADILDLNHTPITQVIRETHIRGLPANACPVAIHLASQQLNCLELIEAIINMADTAAADDVRLLMDRLALQAPELLLLGLAQLQPFKNSLHQNLVLKLLSIFVIGHANSNLVFMILWKVHPQLLLEGFLDMYKKDATSISRILDIAQEAKILVYILRAEVPFFTLDLASLAARRQHLNLEKWLTERLSEDAKSLVPACLEFLERKCAIEMARQSGAQVIPSLTLSVDVIMIFFRVLLERSLSPAETAKLAKLNQLYSQLYSQLMDAKGPVDRRISGSTDGDNERNYAPDVEEMVRLYFERLYTGDISAERFASVLKACQSSKDPRQVDFFSCTVHILLDEARFFNQYPENELLATGELLGLLVDQHLISYQLLRVALKHVLDALSQPPGTKLFNFGVQTLLQFRRRLSEWPQYILLLSKVDGLKAYPPITETISGIMQQLQKYPEAKTAGNFDDVNRSSGPDSAEASPKRKTADQVGNVSALLQSTSDLAFEDPPPRVQERISFLINNLSLGNLSQKLPELRQLLQEPTWGWFSHYLVVRRVSIEPNNHDLYMSLLNELDILQLNEIIIEETYRNIRLLLQSESIATSSSDRNLLKCLGTWLGKMTIAKNKPIRHKDLSFKDSLLDAYDNDKLIVVIPLVCKVLQEASKSKIFRPPNPWLMSIMKLLAELYWNEDLRLNLKFEIEILYKTLDVDLNEIEPTSILEKRAPPGIEGISDQRPTPMPSMADIATRAEPASYDTPSLPATQRPEVDISPLLAKLQFNPAISQLIAQHSVIRITIFRALSDSFAEIVPPIIIQSSSIVTVSTRDLILKDFANEPDETKLKRAAHSMVLLLIGNLVVATCKEPLCNNMISTTRGSLVQAGVPEPLADEIATSVVSENLDLICSFVEQLAQVKALNDLDRKLAPAYASRIAHREQQSNAAYFDTLHTNAVPHHVQLPEVLRAVDGVSPEQMRIYERHDPRSMMNHPPPVEMNHEGVPAGSPVPPPMPNGMNANMLVAKLEQMLLELDRLICFSGITSTALLPPNHDICLLIRQIPLLIGQSSTPLQTMLTFVEKVVYMLYQSSTTFALEIYAIFLQSLFELSGDVTKETLAWLVYADDERKYNASVISMLIRHELLPLEEYDIHLAKLILAKADSVIDFATNLIRLCMLSDTPATQLEDHILTVSALTKLVESDEAPSNVVKLVEDLKTSMESPYRDIAKSADCLQLRILLAEWSRLSRHPMAHEPVYDSLVKKILTTLETGEQRRFFLRLCIETCVNQYVSAKRVRVSHQRRVISLIDAFAKLVFYLTKLDQSSEASAETNQVKQQWLNDTLSIVILVLAQHHEERGANFNQRPFLRLLSSLFTEFSNGSIPELDKEMITAFSDALYTIQPLRFPGFAFSWLQLISHRSFLPQLLVTNDEKGWTMCQRLLRALLQFLGPLLANQELQRATKTFYRGALRVLVVLLHDFPEFLCNNYMLFVQLIPDSCVQLRNLVLSAFPRVMQLPDPFTADLQLDELPESKEPPNLNTSYEDVLKEDGFKTAIDEFLQSKTDSFFARSLDVVSSKDGGYRVDMLGSLVLYLGANASMKVPMGENVAVRVYKYLLKHLTSEGRYLLLNCIVDHLRYPNSHTCFFSSALLHLFREQNDAVKEQITRVLLERLIVNRPHPWGLLASFIELIKATDFWKHEFIRCSPDIERLFDNVSRSIKKAEV
ncbi:CCR4-Not complex component, Not1-domain-containing protein [Radiomyces spectabilis]|uniref:CCR4-Not complex component, Not1-domain-containing protein n=1 Tax=Radiomyces spectabilis TaxID=64574 RepID=UPI00221E4EB3|nr:CCR4-Not complex component, Not1-domain-containing protein [Radiomyces spectabilis]KAI8371784.1 CCR4-Not complex component, Not1-domain-containing protein [Radiomyces spectabilis]